MDPSSMEVSLPPPFERTRDSADVIRLRQSANPDDPEACHSIGVALLKLSTQSATAEAMNYIAQAARLDHPGAHYQMALYYEDRNEPEMAEYHLCAAANQAYEPAEKLLRSWKVSGYASFDNDEEAIELLEEASRAGSNEACCQLALRLTQETGIAPDPRRVAELYLQAAEQGYPPAMFGLGVCYKDGYGVRQDQYAAFEWLSKASERDFPAAWYALGIIHSTQDEWQTAVRCWEWAAALGQTEALFALATAYGRGQGVRQDERKMRILTAQAAEAGHPESQYWLGNYYRFGEPGFGQDFVKAVYWFERASYHDHPEATYGLALHTMSGRGVEQDVNKGWNLAEKAARLGSVDAMMCLAGMIDSGQGPVNDPETARYWYQKAADQGNASAQLATGKRMIETPNEKRFARDYLDKTAAQGVEEAQQLLDQMNHEREPIPQAPSDFLDPAIAGDPQAQFQMGFAHYLGMGVPQNLALSYFWMSVLAKSMPAQATQMLQLLTAQLDVATRKKLDQAADQWKAGAPPPKT